MDLFGQKLPTINNNSKELLGQLLKTITNNYNGYFGK